MDWQSTGAGARCAVHSERPASGVCARCGNFLCEVDTAGGQHDLCAVCRERTGDVFPLTRQAYSFSALWDASWVMFQKYWLVLSLAVLIPIFALFVMSMVLNLVLVAPLALLSGRGTDPSPVVAIGSVLITFPAMFAVYAVVGAIGVGFFRMIQDVQEGRAPDVARMFSQFRKMGRMLLGFVLLFAGAFLVSLIIGVVVAVLGAIAGKANQTAGMIVTVPLMVVFYVVLIYFTLPFQFFLPELALTEEGAVEALKNCWAIVDGYRWHMILLGLVFLPISFLGLLACGIGLIPAYALMGVLFANQHRALRNGAALPFTDPARPR